jgi:hypothetical protein
MNNFFSFNEQMLYLSAGDSQNTETLAATVGGVAENYLLGGKLNAFEPLISCTGEEPQWPALVPEQFYPVEMMAPAVVGFFEDSTSISSTELPVANEENAELAIPKGKPYVTFFNLTQSIRGRPSKPIRGNNSTGRAGKFLCTQCRDWRVKVQYISFFKIGY